MPIPYPYQNRVRSIDTFDIFIVLWTGTRCNGRAMRLERHFFGTSNLDFVGFHNRPSSLQIRAGVDLLDAEAIPPKGLAPEYDVRLYLAFFPFKFNKMNRQPVELTINIMRVYKCKTP